MARERRNDDHYKRPVRRLLVVLLAIVLFVVFLTWRIDSPRVERFRLAVLDRIIPNMEWAIAPVTGLSQLAVDFQSYQRLSEQNQQLRRELQQIKGWREAALQLEQENAKLRDLINVQIDPKLTYITGVVLTDSGSPFQQSVLLNVGARDGIVDGWAAMDGLGLVGRISGVGQNIARVVMVTDTSSRIPVTIKPSGQRAVAVGDNTLAPPIDFLSDPDQVKPGDRVVTSGDGGVFPADLLIGHIVVDRDRRLRIKLVADFQRLEFLRILRSHERAVISDHGALLAPLEFPRFPNDLQDLIDAQTEGENPEADPQ